MQKVYTDIKDFCLDVFKIYNAFYQNEMYMYGKIVQDNQIKYTIPSNNSKSHLTLFSIEPNNTGEQFMYIESQVDFTPSYLYLRFDNTDSNVTLTKEYNDRTINLDDYPDLLIEENYFQQSVTMDIFEFDVVYMFQYFKSKQMHSFYFDLDYYEECKKAVERIKF